MRRRSVQLPKEIVSESRLTHDAWAVIFYDMETSQYRLYSYKDGEFLAADMRFAEDGSLIWGFPSRGGTIRFTIRLNDKGQWNEIGEYSPDGERWFKNFEMTLNRVAKPAPDKTPAPH